jgi:hypothetical protein
MLFMEYPSRDIANPWARTTKLSPSPPPSAIEQELADIHLPSLLSLAWLSRAGPTSDTDSGLVSMLLVGKNHTSSNPKNT